MEEEVVKFMNAFTGILEDCDSAVDVSPLFGRLRAQELNAFIGQFPNWKHLNEDCQRKIVEYLDHRTRFKLSLCSKSDQRLVSKVPYSIFSIGVDDGLRYIGNEKFNENVLVKVKFSNQSHDKYKKRIQLIFEKAEKDTHIRWVQKSKGRLEKKRLVLKNKDHEEEAVKFMEEWLRRCNYGVSELYVEMTNYPFKSSRISFLPKCTSLGVRSDDENVYRWWLERVPEHLQNLSLFIYNDYDMVLSPGFLSSPQILNTKEFFSMADCPFSEAQFLAGIVNWNNVSFRSTNIPDSGINEFIRRWVNGTYKIFRSAYFLHRETRDVEALLDGVRAEEYEDSHYGRTFIRIRSKVDPLAWLKVQVDDDTVTILKLPYDL